MLNLLSRSVLASVVTCVPVSSILLLITLIDQVMVEHDLCLLRHHQASGDITVTITSKREVTQRWSNLEPSCVFLSYAKEFSLVVMFELLFLI